MGAVIQFQSEGCISRVAFRGLQSELQY
jgi:hypothetical protein